MNMDVQHFLSCIFRYLFSWVLCLGIVISSEAYAASTSSTPLAVNTPITNSSNISDFMKIVVANDGAPTPKAQIAFNNIYALNDGMFPIYDKSLAIYKQHFLDRHN